MTAGADPPGARCVPGLDDERARTFEGLEQEVAVLRLRLKAVIYESPTDLRLLADGIQVLTRAVAAQYRLSPKSGQDLADGLAAVLNSFGDQILPADS